MNKTMNKDIVSPVTVNIEQLSKMLSCGNFTSKKIAEQAEARIVIGRRVLYSVDKIHRYLESIAE